MVEAYICEGIRTPIGRYGGSLSSCRPDDLAAMVIRHLTQQMTNLQKATIDDVILGCANQAGEDNRNIARMATLLSGLDIGVPGVTVNRLCGSGLDAVAMAGRMIKSEEADLIIAGGTESMSRAPFVMAKATQAFSRESHVFDTTIGWRFVNPLIKEQYGIDSMPETAENVAAEFSVKREDQDAFAYRSQQRAAQAIDSGRLAQEIVPVTITQRKAEDKIIDADEHPRLSPVEKLATLPTPFRENGTITAANASGVNDGACALIVASEKAINEHGLTPKARILGAAVAGVSPRIMGIGPVPATQKLLQRLKLNISDIDVIELNEAFAAQALATLRQLDLPDDAPHVNANGGAIALGHPLGMSGARLALTAATQLQRESQKLALCTMCIGVGQGISLVLERVD